MLKLLRMVWSHRRMRLGIIVTGGVVVTAVALLLYYENSVPTEFLPSRSMMVGAWRSSSGAVTTLHPDGTFTERGLPSNAGVSSTLNIPADGSGMWRIGPPGQPAGVTFDFVPSAEPMVIVLLVERLG